MSDEQLERELKARLGKERLARLREHGNALDTEEDKVPNTQQADISGYGNNKVEAERRKVDAEEV